MLDGPGMSEGHGRRSGPARVPRSIPLEAQRHWQARKALPVHDYRAEILEQIGGHQVTPGRAASETVRTVFD